MKPINVAQDFHNRLTNRNSYQGDGLHTAELFRNRYLSSLDNVNAWSDSSPVVELDFSGVVKIGPSFANEAFAYFTKYGTPDAILQKIKIINATIVQRKIIEEELNAGYFELK